MEKVGEVSVEGNPDCVTALESGFVVSTYTLDKETGEKRGSLLFFQEDQLKNTVFVESGVLDTKLIDKKLFSCCSNGSLILADSSGVKESIKLSDSCCSYLDSNSSNIYCTGLDGNLHTIDKHTFKPIPQKLNPYEIWFVACTENLIFVPISIGKLLIKDIRTSENIGNLQLHESEISSILITNQHIHCGSFDGTVSTTDLRSLQKLSTLNLGGGVWRLKLAHSNFLTANMEEGFKYCKDSSIFTVPTTSLAYSLEQLSDTSFIGCSFYDSKLIQLHIPNL